MKAKVTTADALSRLENLLPGQLSALGVGRSSQAEVADLAEKLKKTLATTLKPIESIAEAKQALATGSFKDAYVAIAELEAAFADRSVTQEQLEALKTRVKNALNSGLQDLQGRLGFPPSFTATLLAKLNSQIDQVTPQTVAVLLDTVANTLRSEDLSVTVVDEWLRKLRDAGLNLARESVLARFDRDVSPVFKSLGLSPSLVDKSRATIELGFRTVEANTESFLAALERLLNGVEERRYMTQSPLRKLWRRLREDALVGTIVFSLLATLLLAVLFYLLLPGLVGSLCGQLCQDAPGYSFLIALILALILAIVATLVMSGVGRGMVTGQPSHVTPLEAIETWWNKVRGRNLNPDTYNIPPTVWEVLGVPPERQQLTPENVAWAVLNRSDQQRDEEASRQRWLRVISAIVGLVLAYLLQIDAARLLDAAVPGVGNTINAIFSYDGEQLHAMWVRLPANLSFTAGMVLTGLAASAGSTFWHDFLGRLQATKAVAEGAASVLKQAQDIVERK
jgi:hypothetical protein